MSSRSRQRTRSKKSPTGEMTLVEHLEELRRRVIRAVLFLLLGTVVGFVWYSWAPLGLPTLGDIVRGPYCSLPPELRADFSHTGECRLLATSPMEMFMLRLKVAVLAGSILSSPLWLYQLWAFITPGLHKNERRSAIAFVSVAVFLFAFGAVLAYFILDFGLYFLSSIGQETQIAAWTGDRYYRIVLTLVVVFGIAFEVPLVIATLNILGLLEYSQIRGKRRVVWVIVYIFAAFLSPGGDPYSMLALGTAVGVLVELSFQFCCWNDKRRGYDVTGRDLDDDEASEIEESPSAVGAAGPVAAPSPVSTPGPVSTPRGGRAAASAHRTTARDPRVVPPDRTQRPTTTFDAEQNASASPTRRPDEEPGPGSYFDDVL